MEKIIALENYGLVPSSVRVKGEDEFLFIVHHSSEYKRSKKDASQLAVKVVTAFNEYDNLKKERDLLIDALRECADDLKRMKRNEASRIETDFDRIEKWAFDTTIKYYCILNDIKNK